MTRLIGKLVAVTAVFGVVAGANATDYITYTGTYGPDLGISLRYDQGSTHVSYSGVVAGYLQFQDNSKSGNPTFETICGDIFDDITGGDKYSDTLYHTDPSSNISSLTFNHTDYVSVADAGNIVGNVFATPYDDGAGANTAAAGLQIAVWATEYDGAFGTAGTSGITSETKFENLLTYGNGIAGPMTVGTTHDALVDAYHDWQQDAPAADALFLFAGNKVNGNGLRGQDQFTTTNNYTPSGTPEPFTMGLGVAGIAIAVRRRMKRSS